LRIEVKDGVPEDAELRRRWNELALKMERPEVFYTYEWALAVQRSYGNSLKPLLFLGYEAEALIGLVAFGHESPGSVTFLTANTGDYCDFISAPVNRSEFIKTVFSELGKRDIRKIILANLPADSLSVKALSRTALNRQYYRHSREGYLCARVVLGGAEERAAVKLTTMSKKRLRRNIRTLGKFGALSVRHSTRWDEIEPILQTFYRAHVARFLMTARISVLTRPERRQFLYELARESGWVTLSRLQVGETTAAWNYGFQFAGSWFWYQPTVNSIYEDLSPGYCLLAKIVELACDLPELNVVDLGLGAEDYKDRFATANRQTLYVVLSHSFIDHFRAVARDTAAAVVKRSPAVERSIRGMISLTSGLASRLRKGGPASLASSAFRKARRAILAIDEVRFFEWAAGRTYAKEPRGIELKAFDSVLLGAAAIYYADDPSTLAYLLRSAQRIRADQDRGFVLLNAEGTPLHFLWAKEFEGFNMAELDRVLHAPSADAMMIFDCYTPASVRGRGYFADAIAALADLLRSEDKEPWIFGATTNQPSLRGIEKSGFTYKFTLDRKKFLFFQRAKNSASGPQPAEIAGPVHAP
jgi:CelD/BcsL family acetyltransferase involved in cellulose biosynthesis